MMGFAPTGLFSAGRGKASVHFAPLSQYLIDPSLVCVLRC
jgi:hypothetical protein